jgi:hypothetical protein
MNNEKLEAYHLADLDHFKSLNTPGLLYILKCSRKRCVCSCVADGGHHCGDEVLDADAREFNRKQFELQIKVKSVLSTREHVSSVSERKVSRLAKHRMYRPIEKKHLAY